MTAIIRSRKVLSVLVSLVIMLSVFSVFGGKALAEDAVYGFQNGTEYQLNSQVMRIGRDTIRMASVENNPTANTWTFVFGVPSSTAAIRETEASITRLASDVTPTGFIYTGTSGSETLSASAVCPVFSIDVNPAAIDNLVYNGTDQALVHIGTASTTLFQFSTDGGQTWSSDIPTGTDADTYDIVWRVGTTSVTHTISVTIYPADVTVTADAVSKTQGEADPALTYTSTGLIGSDTLTGELSREAGEDAGTYAITQGTLAAGSNYSMTFTGADFTITAAPAPQPAPAEPSSDPVPVTYSITEGADSVWNGSGDLVFRAVRDIEPETTFDHFVDLVVDNQPVPADCYTVQNGSVIVTVSGDYLTSLPDGQHTIRLEFNDPACAEAYFTKAPAAPAAAAEDESMGTGDATVAATGEAESFVAVILFAMSAACVCVSIKLKKEI